MLRVLERLFCFVFKASVYASMGFPGGSEGKATAYNVGHLGSIPGSGRSPGEGNGNPLQYSCLKNPLDGEAWQATIHGVAKSWTRLSNFTLCFREDHSSLNSENSSGLYLHATEGVGTGHSWS